MQREGGVGGRGPGDHRPSGMQRGRTRCPLSQTWGQLVAAGRSASLLAVSQQAETPAHPPIVILSFGWRREFGAMWRLSPATAQQRSPRCNRADMRTSPKTDSADGVP